MKLRYALAPLGFFACELTTQPAPTNVNDLGSEPASPPGKGLSEKLKVTFLVKSLSSHAPWRKNGHLPALNCAGPSLHGSRPSISLESTVPLERRALILSITGPHAGLKGAWPGSYLPARSLSTRLEASSRDSVIPSQPPLLARRIPFMFLAFSVFRSARNSGQVAGT